MTTAVRLNPDEPSRAIAVLTIWGALASAIFLPLTAWLEDEVWAADIPDEEGVASQHSIRRLVVGVLPDNDADRLGRVPGCVQDLELHVAETDLLAVGKFAGIELRLCNGREADLGSGRCREFEVARQEVGVEMGFDNEFDGEAFSRRILDVFVDVASGVYDDGPTGGLISDEI
ncbi:hypothetical protein GQR58_029803 [Nymphon striatum]|nr:hypothetical protein GQR58_029803 [Nymphon striatum]